MSIETLKSFSLSIRLGGHAMSSRYDIARSLREIADDLENRYGVTDDIVIDDNGNHVGDWRLEAGETLVACPCCAGWIANRDLSGCEYYHDGENHAGVIKSITSYDHPYIGDSIDEDTLNDEAYICDYCLTEQWAQYGDRPATLKDMR